MIYIIVSDNGHVYGYGFKEYSKAVEIQDQLNNEDQYDYWDIEEIEVIE